MSVDDTTHKKARRRRTIKNAIINIDDVSIESGPGNINWRRIAKKKLTDRELGMLYKRQQILDKLITAAFLQFNQRNSFDFDICINIYKEKIRPKLVNPQSAIMSLCAQSIANLLKNWKGYAPVNKEIPLFRDYFTSSRHWFDSKKVRAMAIHFWIPSLQLIREFAMRAAAQLFPNSDAVFRTLFAEYLNVMILRSVFEGKIKFPNAGLMWLIPASCFRVFLERYNHRLGINVTQQSKGNPVLRGEFVKCINSKHDELKNAINQYITSSKTSTRARKTVALGPIRRSIRQQNNEFSTAQQSDHGRMNMTSNYSASHESPWRQPPSLHQNYPLQDTNTLHQNYPLYSTSEPSDAMTHTYTSRVPMQQCNPPIPPMNPWSFDQMNHNQITLSSYPVHRNYTATYTANAFFQHTNTGATTNPFGRMRRSSYDASVPVLIAVIPVNVADVIHLGNTFV